MNALKVTAIMLAACVVACPAWGDSNDCLHRTVPLNIIARKQYPLPTLTAAALDVYLQGSEVTVDSVKLDQSPRRILLLVDVSGSFLSRYDWINYLATDLVNHVPSPNEIGMATFAEFLELLVPPTTNHEELSNRIATAFTPANLNLPLKHRHTALWDAISGSSSLLGPHHAGDVILVITDGMENTSKTSVEKARDSLLAEGVRLFIIHIIDVQNAVRSSPREQDSVALLGSISDATGGLIINPLLNSDSPPSSAKAPPQLRSLLDLQYGLILNFYRVEITLPHAVDRELPWKLYLKGVDKSAQKSLELRYPKFLVPCK